MSTSGGAVEFGLGLQSDKPAGEYAALARLAEQHGFDVVSVFGDLMFQPPIFPLLEMASATRRVRLGPACLNPYSMAPYEIAGQLAALDLASHGRAYLGLARGTWLGQVGLAQPRPATALAEAAGVVYRLLAGDTGGYEGKVFQLAPGTSLQYQVARPDPPLLIGAWGPRGVALAGRIAAEVKVGGSANPAMVQVIRQRLAPGAQAAGRDPAEIGVVLGAVTVVDTDGEAARARARAEVAMYLAVVAELDPTVSLPEDLLAGVQARVADGRYAEAGELVPDEVLDLFAFSGTPRQVAAQAQRLVDAGARRVEFGTPHGLSDRRGVELLGAEVLPLLRPPAVPRDPEVLVVAGPGLPADQDLLRETTEAELATLGATGRFVAAGDAGALRAAVTGAGTGALVALPGRQPAARRLMRTPGPYADRTVWLDLDRTGPAEVAGSGTHQHGRGVLGLAWGIRHAVHRTRHPARRITYGADPDQWAELRMPPGAAAGSDRLPVVVLLHGGFWRSIWGADLMDALAIDLAAAGFAAWNLEYRRPDRHGWAATVADVAAGIAALAQRDPAGRLDLDRVAVLGHSAGGQLALQAAADGARVAMAVSLAGVLDLAEADRRWLGEGATAAALGGGADALPEVYAAADPLARLPVGVPQLVVQGRDDAPDLVEINRRYARAAQAAGDEVEHLELPGDHFAVIDPAAPVWCRVRDRLVERLAADPE